MAGGENLRIGDAERDEAIALLREHMSAGRITAEEFDERMSAALTAKTRGELTVLFNDLPGRLPGDPHTVQTMPAPIQPVAGQHPAKQSWYKPLAVVVVLAILAMGLRHWVVPLLMMGILFYYFSNSSNDSRGSRQQLQQQTPQDLRSPERQELVALLRQNQRLLAIKRYREMTGANLLTAKNAIDALNEELGR